MNKCTNCGTETKNPKFCSVKCRGKYYSGERNVANRPEIRKFHREHNPMKDPILLEQHKIIMKEVNNRPEINIKRSKSLKEAWERNPKIKENLIKINTGKSCSEIKKEKIRNSILKRCKTKEFKEKYGAKPKPIHSCLKCGKETTNEKYCSTNCSLYVFNRSGNATRGKHWKTPEEAKIKASKRMSGSNNPMFGKPAPDGSGYGKGKYYNTPLQGTKWFRSTWETKYALYLDKSNKEWYYELVHFPVNLNGKQTTYTPDFFLIDKYEFIDIKGYSENNKDKIQAFIEQYPNIKLKILFKKDLQNLGIKL